MIFFLGLSPYSHSTESSVLKCESFVLTFYGDQNSAIMKGKDLFQGSASTVCHFDSGKGQMSKINRIEMCATLMPPQHQIGTNSSFSFSVTLPNLDMKWVQPFQIRWLVTPLQDATGFRVIQGVYAGFRLPLEISSDIAYILKSLKRSQLLISPCLEKLSIDKIFSEDR